MTPENHKRVIQALRNASVLVASHVNGAEHEFAVRQLQLSIALILNELENDKQVHGAEPFGSQRFPPAAEGLQTLGARYETPKVGEA